MKRVAKKTKVDIVFVIPPYHRRHGSGSLFPLGISSIIACLEQRSLTYRYIDCTKIIETLTDENLSYLKEELIRKFEKIDPCLVGIGPCVTPGVKGLISIAHICIDRFGTERVFAGGPFTSLPSQEWFFYNKLGMKYLIKGDGEEAVCKAIQTLKNGGKLSECNLISTREYSYVNYIVDLDALPYPKRMQIDYDQFSERRRLKNSGKTAHIVASRGCPYCCDYCVSGSMSTKFRRRSAGSIAEEMKYLMNTYSVTDIVFYDDCFFTSPSRVHKEISDFCCALQSQQIQMTWQIEIRPDVLMEVNDEEFLLLNELGCRQFNIGVEKTYHDGASMFGKRYDFEKLKEKLAHIHEICSIELTGTFILGGQNETEETVRSLIVTSANMNLDQAEYSPLFVYPDTAIYEDMFSNPREWLDIVLSEREPWGEIVFENDALDKEKLINLVDEAYRFFYKGTGKSQSEKVMDRYNLKGKDSEKNI